MCMRTFEESLDFPDLSRIVQFSKIFRLLREIFSLYKRVPLVSDQVRGSGVEGGYQTRKVDI